MHLHAYPPHGAIDASLANPATGRPAGVANGTRLQVPFNSSFEVLVDELAGGIGGPGAAPIVELAELAEITPTSTSFVTAAPATAFGSARRIASSYADSPTTGEKENFVRAARPPCPRGRTPRGSSQILNNAPYGSLAGKTVQLDPATGFVFETPVDYRAR